MKFEESFDFDHSAAVIMRMFTDKDYFLRKYERLGGAAPELIDCQSDEDRFSITVRHALDAQTMPFPDFIKKRLGDRIMLRQTDAWQIKARTGRIEIDIESTPVDIDIDMQLVDRDAGARLKLAFDIHADVPLVGKKVERSIAEPITRRMHADLVESKRMAADYA